MIRLNLFMIWFCTFFPYYQLFAGVIVKIYQVESLLF